MSAILSADDLNDFISPGVACIKPVETLPAQQPSQSDNPYEVTTEDRVAIATAPPASISLTDCLACSGCVTSTEAVLISLQSHAEVLTTLDAHPELIGPGCGNVQNADTIQSRLREDGKIFIASVSPQSRASIAATYGVTEQAAGNMITHLLSGPQGLRGSGPHNSGFEWVIDTNAARQIALVAAADEVLDSIDQERLGHTRTIPAAQLDRPKRPILTSACPGWICYAEKTHPYILPHISRVKSPQALTGTLVKSVLANKLNVAPDKIWHLAIMPCFDKKLEASRSELTDVHWRNGESEAVQQPVRDVDCVITARELLMLAESRGISFQSLPRDPPKRSGYQVPFPDPVLDQFIFPRHKNGRDRARLDKESLAIQTGTSGGYMWHALQTYKSIRPGSGIDIERGRNADVVEYTLRTNKPADDSQEGDVIIKTARYYGFRNIQNLVRKLKPKKQSRIPGASLRKSVPNASGGIDNYAYIEVMACPGGCSNGGGQIKVGDVGALNGSGAIDGSVDQVGPPSQKAWLGMVDEAYFSATDEDDTDHDHDHDTQENEHALTDVNGDDGDMVEGISRRYVKSIMKHWSDLTGIALEKLVYTSYRAVESDVGKQAKVGDAERVAGLASSIGGGW